MTTTDRPAIATATADRLQDHGRRDRHASVAAVRVVDRGLRQELRGVKIVWQRELIRFRQDRLRAIAALVQPVLFLYVLGTGLNSLTSGSTDGIDLKTFMFPGVLATSVLFTATFSAASIVWDREFGFLREMLVAPVRRGSILIGKALGGSTVATGQSLIILALAGTVGVPYDLRMMLIVICELFLLSFALCAVGLVIAARVQQIQSMMGVMQMLLLPLSFLSGALYPVSNLPTWLEVITLLNPVTYAVHAIRTAVFNVLDAPPEALAQLNPPLEWFGWEVPIAVQLGVVLFMGLGLLWFAIVQFNHSE